MVEIGKTTHQGQVFRPRQDKIAKGGPAKEERSQEAEKGADVDVKLSMKAKLVEFLLVVKVETKETLTTQTGVEQRSAGQGLDLEAFEYNGTPLTELSPEEAQELIAEDGYFGVTKTAGRIADFVLSGAGDNLERLQAGREGVLKGFQEAEEAWGGELPEISSQTLEKALALIDARISELEGQ